MEKGCLAGLISLKSSVRLSGPLPFKFALVLKGCYYQKMGTLLLKILDAKVSVSTWLWALLSWVTGAIVLLMVAVSSPEIADFQSALPFSGWAWGMALVVGASAVIYGLWKSKRKTVRVGAGISLAMWVFGLVSFILTGEAVSVVIIGLPYLVFFSYLFLASTFRTRRGL